MTVRHVTVSAPLTLAEVEVLWLVAEGLTNREIAVRLSRSTPGVDSLCWSLFRKVGARNRAHVVTRGFELGLLSV